MRIRGPARLNGRLAVPGDKSVSHRALILSALADGTSRIDGLLESADVLSTVEALRRLGVEIEGEGGTWRVSGRPAGGLREPQGPLDCGNSGTTARLLAGVVAAHPITCVLIGDRSLSERPMERIVRPLEAAGATFLGRARNSRLPLAVRGGHLRALHHHLPVASAQVKSCLLFAALQSEGLWQVTEPVCSRDHTERMLAGAGVKLERHGCTVALAGQQVPRAADWRVVGDFSSAAFFLVAGLLAADPEVILEGVNTNETRTGLLEVLTSMGADLSVDAEDAVCGEPRGALRARKSELAAVTVGGGLIPRMIDEVPVLAVAAALARGITRIRDASELRRKECDRLHALATELPRMGARVVEEADGLTIEGVPRLHGARVSCHGDHRIAMALAVAALAAHGTTEIEGARESVGISYPGFAADLARLAPDALAPPDPLA
jgi:3-phosphoshikimate 1-carboxyvinyltransferase